MADLDEAHLDAEWTPDAAPLGWRGSIDRVAHDLFMPSVLLVGLFGLAMRLVLGRFEPLPPTNLFADETWYVRVAHSVASGMGFVLPVKPYPQTAQHAPLTVLLLVPASLLEPYGYTAQRSTMALVGAASVIVIGLVARELAGARVGLVAAVVAAVYPGLWVNDLVATSEAPAVLLLAVVLLLVLRYRRTPSLGRLVGLGLTIGLLALDRGELWVLGLLLAVPAIVAVARSSAAHAATVVRGVLVVVSLSVLVVVPWTAYNQVRFHQTVPISTDLGQTLVGANCPESYYGPLTGYDGKKCFLAVLNTFVTKVGGTEADADSYFRHVAATYALGHWHRWPVVGLMRELWLWSLWRPGWTVHIAGKYLGRAAWIAWSQIVAFWLLTPFAIYGFVLARRRRIRVAPLVTLVAFTAAIGLLVVGNLRYRIPAELAWVLLAAVALDRVLLGEQRGVPPRPPAAAPATSVGGSDLG